MMTQETVRWGNRVSKGKWKLAGQAIILPSKQSIPNILSYRLLTGLGLARVTAWKAEPTQTYPCLGPTCQLQAADGVEVGHNW